MKLAANKYSPVAVILLLFAVGFVYSNAQGSGAGAPDTAPEAEEKPEDATNKKAATTFGDPSEITIAATTSGHMIEVKPGSKHYLTNRDLISLTITKPSSPAGKLVLSANGRAINEDVTSPISVTLRENETNTISATFRSNDESYQVTSHTLFIKCDTIGPRLLHAELVETPDTTGTETTLLVMFADDDFALPLNVNSFSVARETTAGNFDTGGPPKEAAADGRTVSLKIDPLLAGQYRLTVKGTDTNALKDKAGNLAGGDSTDGKDQTWVFSALAGRQFGKHVEFPPFAPPKGVTRESR